MVKKLGFGLMRLPTTNEREQGSIDIEQFKKMVDAFIGNGFTYFDTAYMYHAGMSEKAVKEALCDRHDRNSFTLTTKLPVMMLSDELTREQVFEEQLSKCGVEYFDYYLLHALDKDNYVKATKLDCFEFIRSLKAQGRVKHIGFSFHDSAELLDEILTAHPEMEYVQLQINYLDWESKSVQSRLCYETARKHGKEVIVMEPVKGGSLARLPRAVGEYFKSKNADASIPSWAIRFAASNEGVFVVLSGMSDMAQLNDNMSYMKDFKPLTKEEFAIVDEAVNLLYKSIAIPCTSCHYCDGCPKNIQIPKYFELYNAYNQATSESVGAETEGQIMRSKGYYKYLTMSNGKASDCIKCKKCEKMCPQHLEITKHLETVAKALEN